MKLIGLIIVIVLIAGGYYYYTHNQNAQSPLAQYQSIIKLPSADQISAAISATKNWSKDPVNNTPYPKGWQHGPMTVQGKTFTFVTSDSTVPPNYYVSFDFPNSLVASIHLIKCIPNIDKKATTSICLVGDNPEVNAYFNIVAWLKTNTATPTAPTASQ
jgi:hypothetical protein